MTVDGGWRCTRIMSEVRAGKPTSSPDQIRADAFSTLDDCLRVLAKAISNTTEEGGDDLPGWKAA